MVNVWESVDPASEARKFADLYGADGPVLVDESGQYAAAAGLRGVPFNFFVDADGTVLEAGATTPQELHAAAARLLGHDDW